MEKYKNPRSLCQLGVISHSFPWYRVPTFLKTDLHVLTHSIFNQQPLIY